MTIDRDRLEQILGQEAERLATRLRRESPVWRETLDLLWRSLEIGDTRSQKLATARLQAQFAQAGIVAERAWQDAVLEVTRIVSRVLVEAVL